VDQRNHGKSPHSNEFSYELLVADLFDFFQQHEISKAHIIGHSMGGKAAMLFALEHTEAAKKLIVVDAAPVQYEDKHNKIFEALFAADVQHATSRTQVEERLREKLDDEATVQFLLKGLMRSESGKGFEWKFNLDSLYKNYEQIAGAVSSANKFSDKALFIKGEKSDYISAKNFAAIKLLFPFAELVEIKNTGHWVHADSPSDFLNAVEAFL
jgi:pimeloyl-ACP methyl ester carboxylesterase